ncbi:MAG: GntR family transcriptional regulator [Rectinema sp.]|jgi:DNA-binding transcriptional regulator YhcF (GntR family)|uniref:Transcriptional regulator, GntR family n=1 Tax=uncultured spirochete TaxID=156406 RepID=A0A3P3XP49_9SPIR|nr:Transcriptional regulator, GntR family [uncultured spirochete]
MRFSDQKPIFSQIAELLENDIIAERIPAGARLPSARDLASSLEVNPNTAARALQSLAELGVAQVERGTGYYVSEAGAAKVREFRKRSFLDEELPRLFRSMADLGVTLEDIEARWRGFIASATEKKDGIS